MSLIELPEARDYEVPTKEWVVTGSCKRCGRCCKDLMKMSYMLDLKGVCAYLIDNNDGTFSCEIQEAYEGGDKELIELLPKLVLKYWVDECKDYPNVANRANTPERFTIPGYCGFRMIEKV